jgi:hypothetical protein
LQGTEHRAGASRQATLLNAIHMGAIGKDY